MVSIGVYSKKKAVNIENFLLGGRAIGPWMSAFSYGTTYFSAVIFVGYAGMHGWRIGIGSIWIGIGNAIIGSYLAWKLLATRTRTMTHKLEANTMPEFFSKRYLSTSMKVYSALVIFIFLVPYAASVYKGLGALFSTIFSGAPQWICMLIVALLTTAYLVLGGYIATAINNFIQGIIMIASVAVVVIFLLLQPEVGGFTGLFDNLSKIDTQLTNIWGGKFFSFLAVNIMLTSLGTFGLPQMVHKFYAIKDKSSIKKATVISTAFAVIIGCGAYFIGSMGRLFLPAAEDGLPLVSAGYDGVVPYMLNKVFTGNVALNILLSMMLILLLSASMSTLSSIILTSSSAISIDMLPVCKPDIKKRTIMILMKVFCVVFVLLSYLFATKNISFIVNLMSFSWGTVAGSFIGPYIWGLYSKKITKAGAWSGLIAGPLTILILIIFFTLNYNFSEAINNSAKFGVIAMAISFIIVPVVSLFTKKFSGKHILDVFDKTA